MVVLYYTQTYFLDAALETLQSLKNVSKLHLLIEISPESKKSTILHITSLASFNTIEHWEQVLDKRIANKIAKYFQGIASVHFVVHKSPRAISLSSLFVCAKVKHFIRQLSPDMLHFDTVSVRSLGLLSLTRKYQMNITVHDPVPHSGEYSWKTSLAKFLFYRNANHFFFYSDFAQQQFRLNYPLIKRSSSLFRFQPFSFMRELLPDTISRDDYILFFGRMSRYKGIDILLDAIPMVLAKYPTTKFVIAGSVENISLHHNTLVAHSNSVKLILNYLSADCLADLIAHSKFIVCPYRDATQSGVLMTAFAFKKTVLATNVGAFPEYIIDGENGILLHPNALSLTTAICMALSNDYYKVLQKNINPYFSSFYDNENCDSFIGSYASRN
jgi:glycosyltransferase involved in cell wall biosynthesis